MENLDFCRTSDVPSMHPAVQVKFQMKHEDLPCPRFSDPSHTCMEILSFKKITESSQYTAHLRLFPSAFSPAVLGTLVTGEGSRGQVLAYTTRPVVLLPVGCGEEGQAEAAGEECN